MFVIVVKYTKPLSEIDRVIPEHREFLQRYYASGHLLMSGRQEPRTGGVIIANAASTAEVEAIIQQDPFHREQLAEYEIIEFLPTMTAPLLAQFRVG